MNFVTVSDSSKQRTKLRRKMCSVKDDLKELHRKYCLIVPGQEVLLDDLEKGVFHWRSESEDSLIFRVLQSYY